MNNPLKIWPKEAPYFFGVLQGASLCFCSTKTLPAAAGTNCLFLPMVAKGFKNLKRDYGRDLRKIEQA